MILISSQSYYTFCSCTVDILDMFGSSEEQDSTDHRAALDNALTSGSEFSLCYINCICKQNIERFYWIQMKFLQLKHIFKKSYQNFNFISRAIRLAQYFIFMNFGQPIFWLTIVKVKMNKALSLLAKLVLNVLLIQKLSVLFIQFYKMVCQMSQYDFGKMTVQCIIFTEYW